MENKARFSTIATNSWKVCYNPRFLTQWHVMSKRPTFSTALYTKLHKVDKQAAAQKWLSVNTYLSFIIYTCRECFCPDQWYNN